MENQRLLFFIALILLGFAIYQQWQLDYVIPKPETVASSTQTNKSDDQAPTVDAPTSNTNVGGVSDNQNGNSAVATQEKIIHIQTDVYNAKISTLGGDFQELGLIEYPVSLEEKDKPSIIVSNAKEGSPLLLLPQLGLNSADSKVPTHKALYSIEKTEYKMQDGSDTLVIPMTWSSDEGVTVTKSYTFTRGSYDVAVTFSVDNKGDKTWSAAQYGQIKRNSYAGENKSAFINAYLGGVVSTKEEPYEKVDFGDMEGSDSFKTTADGGWLAMIQHYFVAAIIPNPESKNKYYSSGDESKDSYRLGVVSNVETVAAGTSAEFRSNLFIGPKLQGQMEQSAPNLRLTVDYGFLTFLAQPIFWLMSKIYNIVGNWGWTIIFLTIIIKAIFYPLSAAGYKSMAKMKKLAPKMQQLKETYGDDRQKMGQATMELYKKEKVNPVGGCFPMLIQIPVFLSLYWVLLESVEMRQAPWILWIEDMSIKDPFFVLPLIMGVTMFIQQKLNPAPVDPIQAKVFTFMPIMFTVFFLFFPAGLVLYWVVNNILTIAQQYYIQKYVVK